MMEPDEFRQTLEKLELSQNRLAVLFGINTRTPRRWMSGDVEMPQYIEIILRLMLHYGCSPDDLEALLKKRRRKKPAPQA